MPDRLWVAHPVRCRSRVERFSSISHLGGKLMQGTVMMLMALSGLGCHNKGCDVVYVAPTYSCYSSGCYANVYPSYRVAAVIRRLLCRRLQRLLRNCLRRRLLRRRLLWRRPVVLLLELLRSAAITAAACWRSCLAAAAAATATVATAPPMMMVTTGHTTRISTVGRTGPTCRIRRRSMGVPAVQLRRRCPR